MPTSRRGMRARKRAIEENRDNQLYEWLAALEANNGYGPEKPDWARREAEDQPKKHKRRMERAQEKLRRMQEAAAERKQARQDAAEAARENPLFNPEARLDTSQVEDRRGEKASGRAGSLRGVRRAGGSGDYLDDHGITGSGKSSGKDESTPKGGKKAGDSTTRGPFGGTGGTNRRISQPIGGVADSDAQFGYFNMPGETDVPANTGFGPITIAGQEAVMAAHAGDPRYDAWNPPPVPARYLQGDEDRVLNQLYGTPIFEEVQQALKARNPGRSKITYGVIDGNTRDWMREAMGDANALGVDIEDVLFGGLVGPAGDSGGGGGGGYGGGGGGGGGGGVSPVTDAEAIRQAADDIASDILGRRLDPATKEALVAEIHALEMSEDVTGVTTDIDAQLRRKIRERMQGETGGYDYVRAANTVAAMFEAGPGGGVGGTMPVQPQGGAPV